MHECASVQHRLLCVSVRVVENAILNEPRKTIFDNGVNGSIMYSMDAGGQSSV